MKYINTQKKKNLLSTRRTKENTKAYNKMSRKATGKKSRDYPMPKQSKGQSHQL